MVLCYLFPSLTFAAAHKFSSVGLGYFPACLFCFYTTCTAFSSTFLHSELSTDYGP